MDSKHTGRVMTLRTATSAVVVAIAVAMAATACDIPRISDFSDGCKKLSNADVIDVFDAGTTVDGFNYRPSPSGDSAPHLDSNVLAEGDICARYVSGWKDGDRVGNSMVYARTQTGSDAPAVFQRERAKSLTRDPNEAQTLRAFYLYDIRHGDEAFCTVTKDDDDPANGVLVRFGDKVVYVDVPTVSTLTEGQNCDRARQLADELR
ncbi:hypothetical protein ACFWPK_10665 [Nocardia sp. NPDC058519]|uniref:hypothetical protein n=1 Tax=Nocardia sp. NPDC058519 TaxID=3346535 RepID=UPI00364E6004